MSRNLEVPRKANHILHLFLIVLMLFLVRIYYLSTIKKDYYQEKALKPQRREVIEPALRGTIRDRFNLPLAINKVDYQATIHYDPIRDIPKVTAGKGQDGKRVKVFKRSAYIKRLSEFLSKHLTLDPIKIEDEIHSKAALFPNTPFILKKDLSESLYYKLRFAQKDWPGLEMVRASKRFYPQGRVASNVIGYLGAIDENLYYRIAGERELLTTYLSSRAEGLPVPLPKGFLSTSSVEERLLEIKEKVYNLRAQVGKIGIESTFDHHLRGFVGRRQVAVGANGRFLHDLKESTQAVSGQRILLTLSIELQEFAEKLLIQNEKERDQNFALAGKNHETIVPPWIKGGAIVAMIPQTGEA